MTLAKIHKFFTQNILWKLISLAAALLLWFVGMNINNPVITETLSVMLEIRNMEILQGNNYILDNEKLLESKTVELTVRASKKDIDNLRSNKKDLSAYIDLKPIDISRSTVIGEGMSINIKYALPSYLRESNYEITKVQPDTVEIILDRNSTRIYPVTVETIGDVPDNYTVQKCIPALTQVTISGRETRIKTIDMVRLEVDVTDRTDSFTENVRLIVLDHQENNITKYVSPSVEEMDVTVEMSMFGRIPIARPNTRGNVREGYRIASITPSPAYAEVVGDEESVRAMKSIVLDTIDVDDLFADTVKTFSLEELVGDLEIREGTPTEVVVTIAVVKESVKSFNIPVGNLMITGQLPDVVMDYLSDTVSVLLKGSEKAIQAINAESLSGVLDISGLEPGTHRVAVKLDLPDDVVQVGEPAAIELMIQDMPTEPETPEELPYNEETGGTGEDDGSLYEDGE